MGLLQIIRLGLPIVLGIQLGERYFGQYGSLGWVFSFVFSFFAVGVFFLTFEYLTDFLIRKKKK